MLVGTTAQLSCLAQYDKSFINDFELLWEKDDIPITLNYTENSRWELNYTFLFFTALQTYTYNSPAMKCLNNQFCVLLSCEIYDFNLGNSRFCLVDFNSVVLSFCTFQRVGILPEADIYLHISPFLDLVCFELHVLNR